MGYVLRLPQMGMSMDEGTVVEWLYDEGDEVEEGTDVAIVESEKASNELEARETGVLRRILVDEGETIEPGTAIGIVAGPDEDLAPYEDRIEAPSAGSDTGGDVEDASSRAVAPATGRKSAGKSADVKATPGARKRAENDQVDLAGIDGSGPGGVITEDDVVAALETGEVGEPPTESEQPDGESGDVRATPGARKRAEAESVNLSSIDGSGPGGVITEEDVVATIDDGAGVDATSSAPDYAGGESKSVTVTSSEPLSGVQSVISERLQNSYREAVHVTLNRTFETDALDEVIDAVSTLHLDISLNDVLLKATAEALRRHPAVNAHYSDGEHRIIEEINIGVAVDTDDGLFTPVIPDVDRRGVHEVNSVRNELTRRTESGDIELDELEGGTFTVSNLGMFGVDHFNPIINPPQVAILGVGRKRDGEMTLSLSFDHRVINGADAARFLDTLVETLTTEAALTSFFDVQPTE